VGRLPTREQTGDHGAGVGQRTGRSMKGVRRAFLLASLGRYLMMAINLAATLIMARLLAPADYGVAVLGGAVLAVAEAIRALGGGAYLVQQKDLTPAQIHSNFTISMIATAILIAALLLFVRPLTEFFGRPELEPYLRVAGLGFLGGPISYQISALMSRSLAFGRIAFITTLTAAINAGAGIGFALLGWGYMSLAWAAAISTLAGMGLYLRFWRDWSIFRPGLREWRSVLGFGVHDSLFGILSQIGEAVPYLIIGRSFDAGSVGLCQRAVLLAFFPERVILAGVGAVALPVFSQQVRDGQAPKASYLKALGLITAAQWPALVTLILLADPIVRVLLGPQWHGVVPLLQNLAGALLFSFPMALHYPTLVALGAIRIVPVTILAQAVVTIGVLMFAAPSGLKAVALSTFAIVPFCGLLSLAVIRHFLKFGWLELAAATARSALATLACAAGPVAVVMAAARWQEALSIPLAIAAGALAGVGWIAGLWLTRHPLLQEMMQLGAKLRGRVAVKVAGTRSAS
jgi:O-antigen/teichoic acid export membrane protein